MLRSVQGLLAIAPGFRAEGVVSTQLSLPSTRYPRERVGAAYAEIVRRAAALPGVETAGLVRVLPLAGEMGDRGLQVSGYAPAAGESVAGEWQVVSPGYFRALGVRRLAGRLFDARDRPDGDLVAIVNAAFARRYFAGRDPVGGTLRTGADAAPRTIVGVVEDTRVNSLLAEVKPRFYALHGQGAFSQRTMHLVLRSERDAAALAPLLRDELRRFDPRLATSEMVPQGEVLAAATAQPRFVLGLLALLGGLAVALGGVGAYGMLAQAAEQRRRELSVRVVVGARPRQVVGLVAREGALAMTAGMAAGVLLSRLVPRALDGLLHGVVAGDPLPLGVALAAVVLAAATAAIAPAWRAARADAMSVLREG
jgi:predicted permease